VICINVTILLYACDNLTEAEYITTQAYKIYIKCKDILSVNLILLFTLLKWLTGLLRFQLSFLLVTDLSTPMHPHDTPVHRHLSNLHEALTLDFNRHLITRQFP
jgi:hypothetical protein